MVFKTSLSYYWSMGKMLFRPQGNFLQQYREWPLGKIESKAVSIIHSWENSDLYPNPLSPSSLE